MQSEQRTWFGWTQFRKQSLICGRQTGNILIATGSKELHLYTAIEDYRERCFARVLSTGPSVAESVRLGFEGSHLIAMQGPFSTEMNLALLRQTEAAYFVTKETGRAGGFHEKLEAAVGSRRGPGCGRQAGGGWREP